jgi:hypothetical protein
MMNTTQDKTTKVSAPETRKAPAITTLEFEDSDFDKAERIARELGYEQTAYTSTSAMWGLFCLPENPEKYRGQVTRGGCIIKTKEFGLLFVQDSEDITGEIL